jgi:hypothetical protein
VGCLGWGRKRRRRRRRRSEGWTLEEKVYMSNIYNDYVYAHLCISYRE